MGAIRRMTSPSWNSRTVPLDWLTTTARALVTAVIAAAAQCRVPRPLGTDRPVIGASIEPAGGLNRAVAGHDKRPVHLGDLLDRLTDARVANVAFLAAISLERVKAQGTGAGQDVAHVADHDQGPHRLAFASLAADLHRRIDHGLEGLERHPGFQGPQVASGQPLQVFSQPDHGQRVQGLGLEARIQPPPRERPP